MNFAAFLALIWSLFNSSNSWNILLSSLLETKLLTFNTEKSVVLVIGRCSRSLEMREEMMTRPLILSGKVMKSVVQYSYLGGGICKEGVSESATSTIKKRVGKIKQLIFEISCILQDCRINSSGGLEDGLSLWNSLVIPFLYSSADCWVELSEESLTLL